MRAHLAVVVILLVAALTFKCLFSRSTLFLMTVHAPQWTYRTVTDFFGAPLSPLEMRSQTARSVQQAKRRDSAQGEKGLAQEQSRLRWGGALATLILATTVRSRRAVIQMDLATTAADRPTVVVTGATGRVGSALVRNATKARAILPEAATVLEADYSDAAAIERALAPLESGFRLFLACGNVPDYVCSNSKLERIFSNI